MDPDVNILNDMNFYELLVSSPYAYAALLLFQMILVFRNNISELLKIWASRLRSKSKLRRLDYNGDIRADIPNFDVSSSVYPVIKGKTNRVVSVIDLEKDFPSISQVTVDMSSELRPRFTIFYLKEYNLISNLMAVLADLPIELLSTTVIFKSERKEITIFYVSYYGHKIAIKADSSFNKSDILHG